MWLLKYFMFYMWLVFCFYWAAGPRRVPGLASLSRWFGGLIQVMTASVACITHSPSLPPSGRNQEAWCLHSPLRRVSLGADKLPEPLVQPHSLCQESQLVCLAHTWCSENVCGVMTMTDWMNACIRRVSTAFDCYKAKMTFKIILGTIQI